MANLSTKQKQQQFGLILLLIVVILAIVFSTWYFSQKSSVGNKLQTPVTSERDSYNPADVTAGD